ncbi:MAG: hypothetical protein ISP45_07905 [Reyranella sp.]|nr:hypothetical protein [Reyranella sp.]
MSRNNEQPKSSSIVTYEVGYRKPPKSSQFQPGKSGNPKGRAKEELQFKTVNRIVQDMLLKEVKGLVRGKRQSMLALEAVVAKQLAKALEGDTRAAKLVLERADKHIPTHQTLADLAGERPLFTFTKDEARRFSKEKLIEGMVLPDSADPIKDDNDEGQPL